MSAPKHQRSQPTKSTKASGVLNPLGQDASSTVCGPPDMNMRDVVLDGSGDLVLEIHEPGTGVVHYYLVSSLILRQASPYFRALLDPNKFHEGISLEGAKQRLLEKHSNLATIAPEDLPRIAVTDLGQLPTRSKLAGAMTTFLAILHDRDRFCKAPSLHTLALMAIFADRFDTVNAIARYVIRTDWRGQLLNRSAFEEWGVNYEFDTRQLLLAGILLKLEPKKFKAHTANLVIRGSERWKTEPSVKVDMGALWWNLPYGLEGLK